MQARAFFPEGTQSHPQPPSGTRECGILSMGRKVVEQTGKNQPQRSEELHLLSVGLSFLKHLP